MRNYLVFGGRDSRDFGVYISGQGTFSAPSRAYDFYAIPGRNGAVIGNEKRLENIEVSYECFIYANFDKNISDFRSYLLSCIGYQELTDSYHPDEFRMACYVGPFEPTVTKKNDAGSFTLTFNCKPQRFLQSGKTAYSWVSGGEQTIIGKEITVLPPFLDGTTLTSLLMIGGIPTPTLNKPSFQLVVNGEVKINLQSNREDVFSASFNWAAGTGTIARRLVTVWYNSEWTRVSGTQYRVTIPSGLSTAYETGSPDAVLYAQIFTGNPTKSGTNLTFTTNSSYASLDDFLAAIKEFKTTSGDLAHGIVWSAQYAYTTPESFSFTPYYPAEDEWTSIALYVNGQPVNSPGVSQTTAKYTQSTGMENPTPFASEPLIRAYGTGSFVMDGVTVTITTASTYTDIDCEMMDCYKGSTNCNANVTFSTYDFPKLQPGVNTITLNTGITGVEMTPRWWKL